MVAASSLLLWSTSSATTTTTTASMENTDKSCLMRDFNGEQEMRSTTTTATTTTRGSSRNKSGKVLQKKTPQRGLGVAQLERLRVHGTLSNQSQNQFQFHHQHQFPFQEQQNIVSSVPVAARFASPMNIINGQQISNSQQLNFVFNPYRSVGGNGGYSSTTGGSSGTRSAFSDHVQFFQADDQFHQSGNGNHHHLFETAKELSSSQKSHCLFDQCDICLKKKRINGENLGFEGGRAQFVERKSFDGCDFLGLDLGRNWTVNGQKQNEFCVRGGGGGNQRRGASYSSGITTVDDQQEEVEVVAVHRKGKTSIGGGGRGVGGSSSVLMEYDFFPRKASTRSRSVIKKEPSLFAETSVVVVGESSSPTTNLLDLSLKLSC